jgi:hypothetical protein
MGCLFDHVEGEAELAKLNTELQVVNQKIEYFHVLNNAASIANTVLYSPITIEEFRPAQ